MSVLTKVLVVLLTVFSIALSMLVVSAFAKQQNWKESNDKYIAQAALAEAKLKALAENARITEEQNQNRHQKDVEAIDELKGMRVTNEHKIFANLAQGMLLDRMERFPEAKARYEEVLKIDPNQAMALNNLAYLLAERMNNAAEALPYARQAHRLNPNDPGVLDTLGWALSKNGQWGEAAGMLLRAIELDRQNAVAMYHLALVYKAREDVDEAKRFLTSAKQAAESQGDKDLLSKIAEALKGIEGAGRQ